MKNKIAMSIVLCAFTLAMPLSAGALEIKLNNNDEVELNKVETKAKINASVQLQNNTENKNDNDNKKSEIKVEAKNNGDFWNWFKKFWRKEVKNENKVVMAVKISEDRTSAATSTANILWRTNIATKGYIKFNTNQDLVASSTKVAELSATANLEHKVILAGLTPNTTYYFLIGSADNSGNVTETRISHFKTRKIERIENAILRVLFSGTLKVEDSLANVIWVTNKPSTSKVWISTSSTVNTAGTPKVESADLSFFHNLALAGLAPSTTYYYTVSSTDSAGNTITASNSFTTVAE